MRSTSSNSTYPLMDIGLQATGQTPDSQYEAYLIPGHGFSIMIRSLARIHDI